MIRQAGSEDLKQIAMVHAKCFPRSFSTQIGERLLQEFYGEYLHETPSLFFVCDDNGKITGFVNGYYCEWNGYVKRFIQNHKYSFYTKVIEQLVVFNPYVWKKAFGVLRSKVVHISAKPDSNRTEDRLNPLKMADLLSICVLPQYRGTGIANDLVARFEETLKNNGREMVTLSVKPQNMRAIAFYEKMGYTLYRESAGSYVYAKKI